MQILFLTTRLPFPPIGGERLRPFYFIKYLSVKHRIILLSFIERKEELEVLKYYQNESVKIKTVYLPKVQSYINCLGGLFFPLPLQVSYYASEEMLDLILNQIKEEKIDVVICHLLRMAQYLRDVKIKKILDFSDALSLRYYLSSRYRKDMFKFIDSFEYKRLIDYEKKCSSYFDLNLIASRLDQYYFERELNIENLYYLPNGVEIEENYRGCIFKPDKIVLFANFRAYPNQDAVLYFYKEILPLIKKEIKNVKFVIVGACIPRYIYSLFMRDSSVEIYSDVIDIKTYIKDACVSIAPMRISVGIQNKILQSMALKVPVVATSIALGTIEAKHEKEVLLADNPYDFAKNVIRIMKDIDLRNWIAENAFRLVKEKYLWYNIAQRLEELCLGLIS